MHKLVRIGGTTGTALGLVLLGATVVNAAPASSLTVTPATGLNDGQQVAVAGGGFSAGSSVLVVECLNSQTTVSCDGADKTGVSADSTGAVSANLTVRQSFTGIDQNGQTVGQVDCTTSPGCVVMALNTETAATAPISFG